MKHSLKTPRYRICFQTKNKVWIYKNSRVRNFYSLRSKFLLKAGKNYKRFLVMKNMKWTVRRRQMVPYFRKRNRFIFFYKNLFFTKQQLKNFYGGLKEFELRNLFKTTWNKEQIFRTNAFIGSLEQRLGMVLFRMRLLPTIFACNQLIAHHGIFVNNKKITRTNFRVKIGDFITIPKDQWFMFYFFLFQRLMHRFFGAALLEWRRWFLSKKIQYYQFKKKFFFRMNFFFFKKFNNLKKKFLFLKLFCKYLLKKIELNYKNISEKYFYRKNSIKLIQLFLKKKLLKKIKKIGKHLFFLRKWFHKNYHKEIKKIYFKFWDLRQTFHELELLFTKIFHSWNDVLNNKSSLDHEEQLFLEKIFISEEFQEEYLEAYEEILEGELAFFLTHKYKKFKRFKNEHFRYKKYFLYLLRKFKYRKAKKNSLQMWCRKIHWYTPSYLEIDYKTLRASFVYYPTSSEVYFGFFCSFKQIISFYKERAL